MKMKNEILNDLRTNTTLTYRFPDYDATAYLSKNIPHFKGYSDNAILNSIKLTEEQLYITAYLEIGNKESELYKKCLSMFNDFTKSKFYETYRQPHKKKIIKKK